MTWIERREQQVMLCLSQSVKIADSAMHIRKTRLDQTRPNQTAIVSDTGL